MPGMVEEKTAIDVWLTRKIKMKVTPTDTSVQYHTIWYQAPIAK